MARLVAVVESIARPSVTSPLLLYKHGNRNNARHQSRVLSAAEGLVGMANGTGRLTAAQRGRPDLRDTAAPSAGTCGRGMKFWAGRRAAVGGVDAGGFSANAEASQSRMGLLLGIRLEISADGRPRSRSVGGRPKEEMAPQGSKHAGKQGKGVRQEERAFGKRSGGRRRLAGCLDLPHNQPTEKSNMQVERARRSPRPMPAARPRPTPALPFPTAPNYFGRRRGRPWTEAGDFDLPIPSVWSCRATEPNLPLLSHVNPCCVQRLGNISCFGVPSLPSLFAPILSSLFLASSLPLPTFRKWPQSSTCSAPALSFSARAPSPAPPARHSPRTWLSLVAIKRSNLATVRRRHHHLGAARPRRGAGRTTSASSRPTPTSSPTSATAP